MASFVCLVVARVTFRICATVYGFKRKAGCAKLDSVTTLLFGSAEPVLTVQRPARSRIHIQVQVANVGLIILVDFGLPVSISLEQEFR